MNEINTTGDIFYPNFNKTDAKLNFSNLLPELIKLIFLELDPSNMKSWNILLVCKQWHILGKETLNPGCQKSKWLTWSVNKSNLLAIKSLINDKRVNDKKALYAAFEALWESDFPSAKLIAKHSSFQSDEGYMTRFYNLALKEDSLILFNELSSLYPMPKEALLFMATSHNAIQITQELLKMSEVDLFAKDSYTKRSIYDLALEVNNPELVLMFLNHSSCNSEEYYKDSFLWASRKGHFTLISKLLERLIAKPSLDYTECVVKSLDNASIQGHPKVVDIILESTFVKNSNYKKDFVQLKAIQDEKAKLALL